MNVHETKTLWEKVAANLQEWYSEARGWTGEKARIGVKKMDIVGIQHNIKRNMTHLGGRVYDLLQRGEEVAADEQVQALVGTLRRLEQELADREREIEALKTRRGAAATAATDAAEEAEATAAASATATTTEAPGTNAPSSPGEGARP